MSLHLLPHLPAFFELTPPSLISRKLFPPFTPVTRLLNSKKEDHHSIIVHKAPLNFTGFEGSTEPVDNVIGGTYDIMELSTKYQLTEHGIS
jgi:hypothetical protein